jgi:hypothetical protein
MMKKIIVCACFICLALMGINARSESKLPQSLNIVIPLGGNAWVKEPGVITDNGLTNWTDQNLVTSIYFRVSKPTLLNLALRIRVPQGMSTINVTIGKNRISKQINNAGFDTVSIGEFKVLSAGYVKVDLQGISKTGAVYAEVSDLIAKGIDTSNELTYVKTGSSFHFGRRGPSVHLRYAIPPDVQKDVKWFYNEITVPVGMDKVGSYFMADGFGEGYFGMQVNSDTERRVLFSVWSPFNTQDPKSIPDSMKIKLVKKGAEVHSNDFGNEGSGGQSYMHFSWKAGNTYGFLLGAEPDTLKGLTKFTAYFKDVKTDKWYLVASFSRPKTVKYLTSLYSFLENFEPQNGDQTRLAFYNNQWVGDSHGIWHEITVVTYTGDATANANYRKDYGAGVNNEGFYLKNGGFFDQYAPLKQKFERKANGQKPAIDINRLPQQ